MNLKVVVLVAVVQIIEEVSLKCTRSRCQSKRKVYNKDFLLSYAVCDLRVCLPKERPVILNKKMKFSYILGFKGFILVVTEMHFF